MENTQGKKPAEWFKMLKEPYRSEAIAAIDETNSFYTNKCDSVIQSIGTAFNWRLSKKGYDYWAELHNSIKAGETTYLEVETLKPEQMESGKWYVIETETQKYLINFKAIINRHIQFYRNAWNYTANGLCGSFYLCHISSPKSIILATKEEVLKYFPYEVFENVSLINEVNNSQVCEQQKEKWSEKIDEIVDKHVVQKLKPEPIELRPEDLVSGEVYKATYKSYWWIFKHEETNEYNIRHSACIDYENERELNGKLSKTHKFHHATPEEKALLGEEETDWKAKFEEANRLYALEAVKVANLQEKFEELQKKYNELDDISDMIKESWDAKVEEIEHFKSKLELQQNNKEKVYFYFDRDMEKFDYSESLDEAKINSEECQPIYEAVCIGKKKSVLVDEN